VRVTKDAPQTIEVAWPETKDASAIEGTIDLGGAKAGERVVVLAVSDSMMIGARVAKDGTFRLESLPPGTYRIVCSKAGSPRPVLSEPRFVLVEPKKDQRGLALNLPAE
jgi:hypothetical protein